MSTCQESYFNVVYLLILNYLLEYQQWSISSVGDEQVDISALDSSWWLRCGMSLLPVSFFQLSLVIQLRISSHSLVWLRLPYKFHPCIISRVQCGVQMGEYYWQLLIVQLLWLPSILLVDLPPWVHFYEPV